jgi:hypothetical protein
VFKAGELRKQELSLKHLSTYAYCANFRPATNLNEDEPDDLPFN